MSKEKRLDQSKSHYERKRDEHTRKLDVVTSFMIVMVPVQPIISITLMPELFRQAHLVNKYNEKIALS